ncbi:MAG: sel1 repeat family protein [Candidatus Didemnitutus sp.]|nr:sel1 repeat family protein [Candidatus Didemnitutus sp.]
MLTQNRLAAPLLAFALLFGSASAADRNRPIAPETAPARSEAVKKQILAKYREAEILAEKGDADAMLMLGRAYHLGDVYPQDTAKAWDWYLRSYAAGDVLALNNIAIMFRDGVGAEKNYKIAYAIVLWIHMEIGAPPNIMAYVNSNLRELSACISQKDREEALSYTTEYLSQVVHSRGTNMKPGADVLPSKTKLRIKDKNWWLPAEKQQLRFRSPPPWDREQH